MKKVILGGKVSPLIKDEFKKIADTKNTTSSDLLERVLKTYIKQQKQKGVIK